MENKFDFKKYVDYKVYSVTTIKKGYGFRVVLKFADDTFVTQQHAGFKTKKEAEAALAKAISEYNSAGAVFELSETTVADFLDQRYDLYCKPNLKYNTQVG